MFNKRLRLLRESLKLQQQEMAKIFNMTKSTYNNYETGRREPDLSTLDMFATYFNVSADYLLGRTDDMNISVVQGENIPRELQNIGVEYIGLNKELKEKGITPEQIKKILKAYEDLKGL